MGPPESESRPGTTLLPSTPTLRTLASYALVLSAAHGTGVGREENGPSVSTDSEVDGGVGFSTGILPSVSLTVLLPSSLCGTRRLSSLKRRNVVISRLQWFGDIGRDRPPTDVKIRRRGPYPDETFRCRSSCVSYHCPGGGTWTATLFLAGLLSVVKTVVWNPRRIYLPFKR